MKGLLVPDDEPFRYTHDLDELADGVLRVRPKLRDTARGPGATSLRRAIAAGRSAG